MILIGPGIGDSLTLYDHNRNYNEVLVAPTSADLFWAYTDEPASASRFLSTVPLGIEVSVPLSTEVDRDIVIRAIPRTAYSRNPNIADLDTAEQATGVSTRHDATPVLGIVGKIGTRFARLSVDNWNRFARVRRVDISTDPDFVGFTSIYFDLDQTSTTLGGAGTASEFNQLPDWVDVERIAPAYPAPVAFADDTFYVRVAHSAESSARATGATYKDKVESLRFTDFSDTLEIIYADTSTLLGGSIGAGGIGLGTSYQYPDTLGSGLTDDMSISAIDQRLADAYSPGILSNDAIYGQYIGGRKLWTAQQVYAQGDIADWTRDEGPYRPLTLGGLSPGVRDNPSLPGGSPLVYAAGVGYAVQGMMTYNDGLEANSFRFYRATHNGSGVVDDPIFADTVIGRFTPTIWTSDAWRHSGRLEFILEGTSSVAGADVNVPVAVDIYGGRLSSTTTDATGTRGLRVDQYGNAVLGISAPAGAATSGYAYVPTFAAAPSGTPVAAHSGYSPIGAFGSSIYLWNGSAWVVGGGGSSPGAPDTAVQFRVNASTLGGSANFTWNNSTSLLEIDGRISLEHSTASLTDWTLFSQRTLTGSATSGSLAYGSFFGMIDESTAGVALSERANALFRYQRSDVDNDSYFAYNVASQMLLVDTDGELASEYHGFNARVEVGDADVTLQAWTAYYAHYPFGLGAVTYPRGFVAEAGLFSGFGTTNPTTNLHVAGGARFDLGSDATGDIWYRAATTGLMTRLGVGTNGHVLTLASGLPSWAAPAGGTPAAPDGAIQYRINSATFGGSANFIWNNTLSIVNLAGRLALSHSSATLANLGLSVASTLTGSNTDSALYVANQIALDDQNTVEVAGGRAALLVRHTRSGTLDASVTHAGYGIVSDLLYTAASGTFDGPFIAFKSQVAVTAGGTLASYIGFYAQKPGIFDSVTAKYGFVAESDLLNGFGTTSPTATLHVAGTAKFVLGSDATGDIYYRNSSGFLTRLAAGTNGHVLTLTSDLPSWAAAGGGSPGGSNTQIQYNSSGAFGGAANFTWDNSNSLVTLTGRLILTHSSATLTNRGVFIDSILTGSNTQGSLYYANLLSLTDQSTAATGLNARTAALFRYTRASDTNDFSNAYGVVSEMLLTSSSGTFTGTYTAYKAQAEIAIGTTLTTSTGFYAEYPAGFGDITNVYGYIAEGGMNNGFGTTAPTATLHASGTVKLDLGSDATGDTFYRNSSGSFIRLGTSGASAGYVLTLAGSPLLPTWAAASGSGVWNTISNPSGNQSLTMAAHTSTWTWNATTSTNNLFTITNTSNDTGTNFLVSIETPGATNTKQPLRIRANGLTAAMWLADGRLVTGTTDLGAVSSALYGDTSAAYQQISTDSGNTSFVLVNPSTSAAVFSRLKFRKAFGTPASPTVVNAGTIIGRLGFELYNGSAFVDSANITVSTDGASIGAGDTPTSISFGTTLDGTSTITTRMTIKNDGRVGIATTSPAAMLHVNGTAQFDLGSDATGDIWYRNGSGFFTRLAVGTNGHVLTLASGLPSWAAAAGGSPAGSGSEIQYRNAGAFGAIVSSVASTLITFTGYDFTFSRDAGLAFQVKAYGTGATPQWLLHAGRGTAASPTAIQSGDVISNIIFSGQYDTSTSITGFNYGALIQAVAPANWDGSNTPADVLIRTKSALGLSTRVALRATSDQRIGIGDNIAHADVAAQLHVIGSVRFDLATAALDVRGAVSSTTGLNTVAQYDLQSSGTPADGWGMRTIYNLESTTTASRLAAQFDVGWQESTDAGRSAVASIGTVHKAQAAAYQRQIWGAYKDLVDNTRTDIFSVVFGTTDHKAIAGTVRMTIFAKKTSGGNEVQIYKKDIPFLAGHNAATNTGFAIWGGEYGALGGVSTGSITFTFECNTVAFPSYALNANTYTFQLTANTDMASTSEFYLIYDVELAGDVDITLIP